MRYLFYFGHPAHFHLFRHTVAALKAEGHTVDLFCKTKDLLEDLLQASGWAYTNVLPQGKGAGRLAMATDLLARNGRMLRHCLRHRPDLMAGTSPEVAQIGRLLGIPSLVLNEDDVDIVPLFAKAAYPFCTAVVAPEQTDLGRWAGKGLTYPGYQKLAYLHPNRFTPERSRVEHLFAGRAQYFVLRFVSLTAHHDVGIGGFTPAVARRVVDLLEPHGAVWISAEGDLGGDLQRYRLALDPLDIHHALHFATLFAGDSQSMTVESAMLGTPSVRFSDFAGRISVLEELEHTYGLTVGIPASEPGRLAETLQRLLARDDLRAAYAARRDTMLADKIDLSAFLIWLMSTFPDSLRTVRADPATASHFRTPHRVAA
ncbi:MAG: hypothetical protein AAGI91_08945 [Bacteroidota bacterium]